MLTETVTCATTGSILVTQKPMPSVVLKGKFMTKKSPDSKPKFPHIAKVIREERRKLAVISQTKLSDMLGYKNGQFISNIERGLCSLPDDKIKVTAEILQCDPQVLITAILEDHKQQLLGVL